MPFGITDLLRVAKLVAHLTTVASARPWRPSRCLAPWEKTPLYFARPPGRRLRQDGLVVAPPDHVRESGLDGRIPRGARSSVHLGAPSKRARHPGHEPPWPLDDPV